MVVKAIINAIGKSKPKPVKFPEGTKFTKQDSQTLLEEAQVKIDKINAGEIKAKDPTSFVKPTDTATLLGVKADGVSPVLTPTNVKNKIVKPPKPSSQQKVDEFLTDQDQALKNADLTGNEENFLNFKKINSTDDIKASIEALGAQISKQVNKQKRGVQTWKETNDFATILNENPETLAGNLLKLRPGSPLNAAEIKAAKNLLISQHKKLTQLATKLGTEGGDNSKVALEFAQQHALTAELTKVYKGAQTEIARALNILKEPVQEGRVVNLDLDRLNRSNILMNLGGKKQIEAIAELYLETPGLDKKIKFAEKSLAAKTSDALVEIFLNNILSGTLTHVKNIGGNYIFKTIERAERSYAARIYGGKSIDSIAEFEDVAQAFGEHVTMMNMWRGFSQKMKSLKAFQSNPLKTYKNLPGIENKIAGTKFEAPVDAFSSQAFGMNSASWYGTVFDVMGRVFTLDRIPYKFLQNADNFFKNASYQSEVYALGFRETLKQVKTGMLPKDKAADYLAALVSNPPEHFTKKAYETALRRTFQTPLSKRDDALGDVASAIQDLKVSKGLNPLSIVSSQYFTFLRTPTNITGSALERMPGANRILRSYRKALSTPGAEAELAKAKAAMGWAFMAAFVPLGYFGVFSGSDIDVSGRKRYQLKKAGNKQPKSFRFQNILPEEIQELTGLSGSQLQLSLNGFEPAVFLASMASDVGAIIANIQDDWSGWDTVHKDMMYFLSAYAIAFGENVLNATFMNGAGRLADFYQNMKMSSDKTEPLMYEGKKMLSGLVPFTTFLSQFEDLGKDKTNANESYGISNSDDFRKLNFEFKSMIQKMIPGFENDLYFDRDWLGDVVPKFSIISTINESEINKEAIKIGYRPIPIRKKLMMTVYEIQYGELDYGIPVNIKLKEQEYALLQRETGRLTKQYLTELINSKEYQEEQDQTYKLTMFKKEVERAKEDVKNDFKDPELNPLWNNIEARAEKLATKKWTKQQGNQEVN